MKTVKGNALNWSFHNQYLLISNRVKLELYKLNGFKSYRQNVLEYKNGNPVSIRWMFRESSIVSL